MLKTLTSQADDLKMKISKVEGVKSQLETQKSRLDSEIETLKQGATVGKKQFPCLNNFLIS